MVAMAKISLSTISRNISKFLEHYELRCVAFGLGFTHHKCFCHDLRGLRDCHLVSNQ